MEREALTERSALELASLIREREVSPVEVARAFLARIERVDPAVHAFVTVTADLALAQAEETERALSRPTDGLGPLHGVPVAIKDLVETRGVRTTFNSRAFAEYVPEFDAEVVARLRAAGAVTLGKTNTPEFGLNATTEEGINPPTRNPWDPTRSAGGSSGGTAP
ncbi:MAG: amidase, partial [Thermomicrobiaceae bacterium]|nr:amidase [Thermomicrobiaceae bacterium]